MYAHLLEVHINHPSMNTALDKDLSSLEGESQAHSFTVVKGCFNKSSAVGRSSGL